jgi:hypothetical protein
MEICSNSKPPDALPRNPFSGITRVYENWRDKQTSARKEVSAQGPKGTKERVRMMIYPSPRRPYQEVRELDNAAAAAGRRVISDWVSAARLCSQSDWVEKWITSHFKEGPPDLSHWLSILKREKLAGEFRKKFPEPASDPRDMGPLFTYAVPTTEDELRATVARFREEATAKYRDFRRKDKFVTASYGPGKKGGNYEANHFTYLAYRICLMPLSKIREKFACAITTGAITAGTRSCAQLVDIIWPIETRRGRYK